MTPLNARIHSTRTTDPRPREPRRAASWPLRLVAALAAAACALPLAGCVPVIGGIIAAVVVLEDEDDDAVVPVVTSKTLGSAGGTDCEVPPGFGDGVEDFEAILGRRSGDVEIRFVLQNVAAGACLPCEVLLTEEDGSPLEDDEGDPIEFEPADPAAERCAVAGQNILAWDSSAITSARRVLVSIRPAGGYDAGPPLSVWVDGRPGTSLEVSDPVSPSVANGLAGDVEIRFRVAAADEVDGEEVRALSMSYTVLDPPEDGAVPPPEPEPRAATIDLPDGLPPVGEEASIIWHSSADLGGKFVKDLRLDLVVASYEVVCQTLEELSLNNVALEIRNVAVGSIPAAADASSLVGQVLLEFDVVHADEAPAELSVRVAAEGVNGGNSFDATEAEGFREPGPIATSPEGTRHRFVWNSEYDIARLRDGGDDEAPGAIPVSFRIAVTDPRTGLETWSTVSGPRNLLDNGLVHTAAGGVSEPQLPLVRAEAVAVGERWEDGGDQLQAYYVADPDGHAVWRASVATGDLEACGGPSGAGGCLGSVAARHELVAGRGEAPGSCGAWGAKGPAAQAALDRPSAVAFDADRAILYIADAGCGRVAAVDMSAAEPALRSIVAVAGSGAPGSLAADIGEPAGLALSSDGATLWIADGAEGRVFRLDLSGGDPTRIRLVVTNRRFEGAASLALAEEAGALYAANPGKSQVVGLLLADGAVFTAAGTGKAPAAGDPLREGAPLSIELCTPSGVSVAIEDGGERLYIAERDAGVVRSATIQANGTLGSVTFAAGAAAAGAGRCGGRGERCAASTDGQCLSLASVPLLGPSHAVADADGRLLVADAACGRLFAAQRGVSAASRPVCRLSPEQVSGGGADGRPAVRSPIGTPSGLLVRPDGTIWIGDSAGRRIGGLDPETGRLSTVAGRAVSKGDFVTCGKEKVLGRANDQVVSPKDAVLGAPGAMAQDSKGNVYIADSANHVVWVVRTSDGKLRRFAGRALGNCTQPGFNADLNRRLGESGSAVKATDVDLNSPSGLAVIKVSGAESLCIADTRHHRVIRVRISDKVATRVAGLGRAYSPEEEDCASDGFFDPRLLDPGDGGPGRDAVLNLPGALAFDGGSDLYIADAGNHRIRRLDLLFDPPTITTAVGTGSDGTRNYPPACDPTLDPAANVNVDNPPPPHALVVGCPSALGVRRSAAGGAVASWLLFADGVRSRIWSLDLAAWKVELVAGRDGIDGFQGEGGAPASARFRKPAGLVVDGAGNLYVADSGNSRVRSFRIGGGEMVSPPAQTILDDGRPGTAAVGSWRVSGSARPYGTQSLYAKSVASYTWTIPLPAAGTYEVLAWWTVRASRSQSAPYSIATSGGETVVTVDQRVGGGQWNRLGTFDFGAQAVVRLDARADGASYCADAILIRPVR